MGKTVRLALNHVPFGQRNGRHSKPGFGKRHSSLLRDSGRPDLSPWRRPGQPYPRRRFCVLSQIDMDSPPPGTTERGPSLVQRCARALLRAFGWHSVLVPPPSPKGIIVVYPHTSNWDFIIGVLYKIGSGLPIRWMGKDTLFHWSVRRLLLRIGGIPVNRHVRSGFVDALLAEFARSEWMW